MKRQRPTCLALPPDVRMGELDWYPSQEEKAAVKLRNQANRRLVNLANLQKRWAEQEAAYLRRRETWRAAHIASILRQAEEDKIWLERQRVWDQEIERRRNFYLSEHEKEAKAIHAVQLKKLQEIQEDIRRDAARVERQELLKRGVVRGRRPRAVRL